MATTFSTKSTSEIVDDILLTLVTTVPDVTDINPGSVIRTLTEAVATEVELVYQELDDVYQGTRIDTSTGDDLDNLAAIVGLTRNEGLPSSGNITFLRNAPAGADFTIAQGAIVSTQPNTGDDELRFTVDSNTTFSASITAEAHEYVDGITDYRLNERFANNVSNIEGTVSAAPYTFALNTDYVLVEDFDGQVVDVSTIVDYDDMEVAVSEDGWFGALATLDSTDVVTGWSASTDGAITLNSTPGEQKEGVACLNLEKSAGVNASVLYEKTLAFVTDFTGAGRTVFVWYYIDDTADLDAGTAATLRFGNDNSNYYYLDIANGDLANGWNLLYFEIATATGQVGTPTSTTCDYVAIEVNYLNSGITKTGNEQRLDYWRVAYVPIEDAVEFREGTKSLRFTKLDTTTNNISYEKLAPSVVNSQERDLVFWLRILDNTVRTKIANIEITIGSGGSITNSYRKTLTQAELATGWNLLVFDPKGADVVISGIPAAGALNYARIKITTVNAADTIASGDLNFDYFFFADAERYIGDLIRWLPTGTLPDDSTDFEVDYIPLSKEVPCTSEDVGAQYNVARNKVIFKISIIANIDNVNNYEQLTGGTDEETDNALRSRVQSAAQAAGKATVEALRQAVLAVNGVVSVNVDDLPRKTATNELHTYSNLTDIYTLDNEIVLDNVNLVVEGTAGAAPYTFVKGTDYILVDGKDLQFQIGGTDPDDGTDFFVDYEYDWLGHVEIFVSGTTTPLPLDIQTAIDTAIEDTRAAGVVVDWFEPTVVAVNVSFLVAPDTGFTFSQIQQSVRDAVEAYLNSAAPGENIYIAELYQRIQEVDGVLNSSITVPASDVTIAANQVAKAGTITVGSL